MTTTSPRSRRRRSSGSDRSGVAANARPRAARVGVVLERGTRQRSRGLRPTAATRSRGRGFTRCTSSPPTARTGLGTERDRIAASFANWQGAGCAGRPSTTGSARHVRWRARRHFRAALPGRMRSSPPRRVPAGRARGRAPREGHRPVRQGACRVLRRLSTAACGGRGLAPEASRRGGGALPAGDVRAEIDLLRAGALAHRAADHGLRNAARAGAHDGESVVRAQPHARRPCLGQPEGPDVRG